MNLLPKDLLFLLSTYLGYEGTVNLCHYINCQGIWSYKLNHESIQRLLKKSICKNIGTI